MVSGVIGNMSGMCWTHEESICFCNLKLVGDKFQNGSTAWWWQPQPNLA